MIVIEKTADLKNKKRWGFIYIINVCNKNYVGKTINLKNRYHQHLYEKRNNQYFHRSLKKYFQLGCLRITEAYYDNIDNLINILNEREMYLIKKLDTYDPKQEKGWNLTLGGDGSAGWITPEKTKEKQSMTSKGKPKTELHKQHMKDNQPDRSGSKNGFFGKNNFILSEVMRNLSTEERIRRAKKAWETRRKNVE